MFMLLYSVDIQSLSTYKLVLKRFNVGVSSMPTYDCALGRYKRADLSQEYDDTHLAGWRERIKRGVESKGENGKHQGK